jgi:hypothetical protein
VTNKPLDANERALQRSLDNVRQAIQKTLATLKWVEDNQVAERGPLVPVITGDVPTLIFTSHNEKSNPSPVGVRTALSDHLRMLLKLQQSQMLALRRRHAWLVLQTLTQDAGTAQTRFRSHMRRELQSAAHARGFVPEDKLKQLKAESDRMLLKCATALDANPSRKNFEVTLKALGDSITLLSSIDAEMPSRATESLQRAAAKRLARTLKDYRAVPSAQNAKVLSGWIEKAMLLGCDSSVTEPAVQALQGKSGR